MAPYFDIGVIPEQVLKPKHKWNLKMINHITNIMVGHNIESLYDYEIYKNRSKTKLKELKKKDNITELDEYMWSDFTEYLETSRVFVFNTYKEEGVNESESYFLSLKFIWSTLRKFRSKFYRELDNRTDYDSTPLKISINFLMFRIRQMMANESYKFSRKAANGRLGKFRTDCAWETARHLAEETGVIFHAKVTL